jgi:hypothetical protein
MKFSQLPIGQRFELDGAVFVKTSPMMAAKEGGGESRFMARYVVVKVLGGEPAPARPKGPRMVEEAVVAAAFDGFHSRCREVLARELPAEKREAALAELDEGRRGFLDALSRG